MALAVPYRGANHRDALAGLRSPSCYHLVCDVEPRTYPRIVCEPVFGVAANTMYAHMCGVVKPSKKNQNPGTPRTRSLLSFTCDPGRLVQQHQAPVACFDEIKRGLHPLPNSSSREAEATNTNSSNDWEGKLQARFGMLFSPVTNPMELLLWCA